MALRQLAALLGALAVATPIYAQSTSTADTTISGANSSERHKQPTRPSPATSPRDDVIDRATARPSGTAAEGTRDPASIGATTGAGATSSATAGATNPDNGTGVGVGKNTGLGVGVGVGGTGVGVDIGAGAGVGVQGDQAR